MTLYGERLESPDIRAGMAMVIAALQADGTSTIGNIGQIDRGYERMDERLRCLGAAIERVTFDGGGSGADRGRPPRRELDRDTGVAVLDHLLGVLAELAARRQAGDRPGRAGGRSGQAGRLSVFKPFLGQRVGIVAADEALDGSSPKSRRGTGRLERRSHLDEGWRAP